jgi:hypothetical protein
VPVVEISPATNDQRSAFFRLAFGRTPGYVCIAYMQPTKRGLTEYFYRWPDDENQLLEAINQNFLSQNVYFCPQLLAGKSRIKENVMRTPSAWADLDRCNPSNLLVEPSITIETSPNR